MLNITKMLSDEHKNILKVIDALVKECERIEKGKDIDEDFFKKIIDFIRNYADKFHHAKEEDLLFKEICNNEEKMHCNPVQQMLFEHEEGRKFVKSIEEGLKEDNKKKIIENSLGYCYLLKDHIYKEDNILYPMAEEGLDEKKLSLLLKKFKDIDIKKKKDINKYLKFVKNL